MLDRPTDADFINTAPNEPPDYDRLKYLGEAGEAGEIVAFSIAETIAARTGMTPAESLDLARECMDAVLDGDRKALAILGKGASVPSIHSWRYNSATAAA